MARSYTDSLDFTHLEAETDDNADFDSFAVENAVVQPTVALPPPPEVRRNRRNNQRGSVEIALSDAAILPSDAQDHMTADHDITGSKSPGEGFEDTFVNGPSVPENYVSTTNQTGDKNGIDNHKVSSGGSNNTVGTSGSAAPSGSFKIHYDSSGGNVSVLDGQMSRTADGSPYINTQGIPNQWEEEHNQPLRRKRIRLIKVFSIIACVFFFPTGIPAIYFAFRIGKEFEEGIMRGNIDRAQKFAKRSERLIILSFVMAFMVGALVVALIERPNFDDDNHHRGTVVG